MSAAESPRSRVKDVSNNSTSFKLLNNEDDDKVVNNKEDDKVVDKEPNCGAPCNRPVSPDGGWAWMVVVGSFSINFLIMGLMKSFGIIIVNFMEVFPQASTASLMWIISLAFTFVFGLAPLTTGYAKIHGFRKEVFIGGILASAGFISSAFINSVTGLYFTIGIISGIGFAMSWVPCLVIVGVYFDKRRNIAMGVTLAGSGLGAFISPVVLQLLLDNYGLKGTLLIFGGLLLNICVAASLYRPMEQCMPRKKRLPVVLISHVKQDEVNKLEETMEEVVDIGQVKLLDSKLEPKRNIYLKNEADNLKSRSHENISHDSSHFHHHPHTLLSMRKNLSKSLEYLQDDTLFEYPVPDNFLREIKEEKFEEEEDLSPEVKCQKCKVCCKSIHKWIKGDSKEPLIKFSLLKSFKMHVQMISLILLQYAYVTYYNLLPVKCSEIGISPSSTAILVSIPSIVEVFGRISMGFVWDMKCVVRNMKRYNSYALGLLVAGIGITCTSFLRNYYWIAATAVVTGWGCSMFIVVTPSLIVELYGIENLVAASGFFFWVQAFPILTGGPLLGFLRDTTGNTDGPFYFMGACMLSAALIIHFIMPIAVRKDEERRNTGESGSKHIPA